MSVIIWLLIQLLGAMPLVYLLRRHVGGALLGAVLILHTANQLYHLPPDLSTTFLGRTLTLTPFTQASLILLCLYTATLFFISAVTPSFSDEKNRRIALGDKLAPKAHGGVQGEEGRTFYPMTLVVLSLIILAVLVTHLGITAMVMQTAALFTVFIIQGGRLASVRASLRFITIISLATPLFLLASWQIDTYQTHHTLLISPQDWQQTLFLIGLGFTLWLAIVPFHSWFTTIATDCYPASAAFVLLTFPMIAFTVLINHLTRFPFPLETTQLSPIILMAGVFTALVGGGLASIQRGFSQLMGYATVYDLGCLVVMLISGQAPTLIFISFISRALALMTLAASTAAIRAQHAHDGFAELRGIAPQMPLATLGLVLGGFTLAGTPLTLGFISHQTLWLTLPPQATLFLMLATLGIIIGYLRGAYTLMGELNAWQLEFQEPFWLLIVLTILTTLNLFWGLYPAWLINLISPWVAQLHLPL